jgi:hypothetical protein
MGSQRPPGYCMNQIVAKLPESDEYTVKNFLNRRVTNLRFREDFTDEVN